MGSSSMGSYLTLHFLQTVVRSLRRQRLHVEWPQVRVTGSSKTLVQNTQLQASVEQLTFLASWLYFCRRSSTRN